MHSRAARAVCMSCLSEIKIKPNHAYVPAVVLPTPGYFAVQSRCGCWSEDYSLRRVQRYSTRGNMGGGGGDVPGAVGPSARRFVVVWLARGSLPLGWFFRSGEVLQSFTFYLFCFLSYSRRHRRRISQFCRSTPTGGMHTPQGEYCPRLPCPQSGHPHGRRLSFRRSSVLFWWF